MDNATKENAIKYGSAGSNQVKEVANPEAPPKTTTRGTMQQKECMITAIKLAPNIVLTLLDSIFLSGAKVFVFFYNYLYLMLHNLNRWFMNGYNFAIP